MTPRQREDDNNLSVGNRNHLKLGIEPESWLQSHETRDREGRTLLAIKNLRHVPQWEGCVAFLLL